MLDEVEKEQERLDRLKGLVASSTTVPERLRRLFPDYFEDDPYEAAKQDDGTYDIDQVDPTEVEWSGPASMEDDEALSAWINEHQQGSFTGADF